jgi:hypothetical protein
MRTTVELPDDSFRKAKARAALQGKALKDLVAEGLKLLLKTPREMPVPSATGLKRKPDSAGGAVKPAAAGGCPGTTRKRGIAGAWARRFAGVAALTSPETTDDARMEHYAKKYGV